MHNSFNSKPNEVIQVPKFIYSMRATIYLLKSKSKSGWKWVKIASKVIRLAPKLPKLVQLDTCQCRINSGRYIPWGAYSYKMMRYYTEHCSTATKYSYYGPAWALYVWGLEKIRGLGGVVGKVKDEGAHPRLLRWEFKSNSRIGNQHLQ